MADPDQPLTLVESIIPVAGLILLVALAYYLFGEAAVASISSVIGAISPSAR
jgi:hypothetical protein